MAGKHRFSLNPLWGHYGSYVAIVFAIVLGIFRYALLDRVDPLRCNALLSRGRWLDDNYENWQPDGCMIHNYPSKDISTCLGSKDVVFIGDTVTRQLFFQMAHYMDASLPLDPPNDESKHVDYHFKTLENVQLSFFWDPFLNSSQAQSHINSIPYSTEERPALLVLGSGLWYLHYSDNSGGLPAWEAKMESTIGTLHRAPTPPADMVVILPIETVASSNSSPERATRIHASDIDAMNSDLAHRIRPPSANDPYAFLSSSKRFSSYISLPLVFNHMLDPRQTEDGMYFPSALVKARANILLNLRCNDVLPKTFPLNKTCCQSYPWPSLIHALVLLVTIGWGPVYFFLARRYNPRKTNDEPFISKEQMPAMTISVAVLLILLADRTGFWLKEQKHFDPWTFSFLCLLSLTVGLLTMKRADSDLGILNREQTDEWKGWMQITILIYHYLGASDVSGIHNPIRVLVASYLFMTGYGHMTYYIKKADFGFLRVAQILVRLNFFTLVLAYTMNTNYISYYFSPLLSWWYLIIYGTMAVGSQFNDHTLFLVAKLITSMTLVTFFMRIDWLLGTLFSFLERFCGIHWSASEWLLQVNLDAWIVYVGMFTALAVIKTREHRLTEYKYWPIVFKGAIGASVLALVWYFIFEVNFNKFDYNIWHPFIAFVPVGAFVILRNANSILRSASSKAFAFIGTCSLETFVIQYHLWLAGDTKGILIVIPATRWRSMNMVLTTIMFIYVSHCVAQATGEITKWICGASKPPASLPTTNPGSNRWVGTSQSQAPEETVQEVIFLAPPNDDQSGRKDREGNEVLREPDTPIRPPRRWVDRLAEGPQQPSSCPQPLQRISELEMGGKTRMLVLLGVMWLLNMLWTYPPTERIS